ncbi:MAG: nitronate monooxygenase [Mycobacterium sp.]
MPFDLADLRLPILGAPMAGGPSTPALAAAVSDAGGLGNLPAGYLTAVRVAEDIAAVRASTSGPVGVNLFVPQPCIATEEQLENYRGMLMPLAHRLGVQPGTPRPDDDDWQAKLEVVEDLAPELVSFTFGCPESAVLERLRRRGVLTVVTVSSREEAEIAVATGAGALVVQGPSAGGHRSVFAPDRRPPDIPLEILLAQTVDLGVPVVAAGGLGDRAAVRRALDAGAVAAQVGTALLLCDEAGTNAVHRRALRDGQFTGTVVTRAFSGRYARSLANDFTRDYGDAAPPCYPQVNQITAPIRAAALAASDPHAVTLWAGTAWRATATGTAAEILAALTG